MFPYFSSLTQEVPLGLTSRQNSLATVTRSGIDSFSVSDNIYWPATIQPKGLLVCIQAKLESRVHAEKICSAAKFMFVEEVKQIILSCSNSFSRLEVRTISIVQKFN